MRRRSLLSTGNYRMIRKPSRAWSVGKRLCTSEEEITWRGTALRSLFPTVLTSLEGFQELEIYDTEMDYQFTLVQMQQGHLGDQIGFNFDNNRLMKTSRANAMRALENYRKDPGRMISQKARRRDGKPLEAKAIPHNPIELK